MSAAEAAMSSRHRRQRTKNLTFLLVLGALVVLFYFITIVKMMGQ